MAARVETRADAAPLDLAAIEAASARQERRRRWQRTSTRTLSLLAVFLAWWVLADANARFFKWFNPVLLPDPPTVGKEAWRLLRLGSLQWDVLASLGRVVQGFVIAALLGVVAGTLVARVAVIENLLEPVLDVLRPIPPLAFLPLLVLYLGIGEASKIGFIAYSAFFPVFTTTREGIKYVDPLLVRAAQSLGASERDILRYVIIPAAMPNIMTGLRLSFALSFFVIVAAEFIAAERGLGFLINDAREFFRVDRMLLGAAAIGLLGYVFNQLFGRLERVLVPWKG
jgi:ABC-type nitrate/sulfonate/bicarbonate transport system permease component